MKNKDLITVIYQGKYPLFLLILMWTFHLLNVQFNLQLFEYGIYPREVSGLKGIIFAPFIHSTENYRHIINNSLSTHWKRLTK